jgi:hypothetical protein
MRYIARCGFSINERNHLKFVGVHQFTTVSSVMPAFARPLNQCGKNAKKTSDGHGTNAEAGHSNL